MRYVIYGAGGIGGALGAGLHRAGRDVVLIARGEHREVVARDGLVVETPDDTETYRIPVVSHPAEASIEEGDAVVLSMKTQDTEPALQDLGSSAPTGVTIVCAQNGVENERLALRRYAQVYGMMVRMPTTFVQPGRVQLNRSPIWGIMDVGTAVAASADPTAQTIAADLVAGGFDSHASDDIMAWKRAKLLGNIPNAAFLACGSYEGLDDVKASAVQEAEACFAAAGLPWVGRKEFVARAAHLPPSRPIAGRPRMGSSSHQSLIRGKGSIESDFINGEVVLLGRLHGVATPVNEVLQRLANRLAAEYAQPGAISPSTLRSEIRRRRKFVGHG